jgi:hypothetical protein
MALWTVPVGNNTTNDPIRFYEYSTPEAAIELAKSLTHPNVYELKAYMHEQRRLTSLNGEVTVHPVIKGNKAQAKHEMRLD